MIFDNRPISEISDDELRNLIGNQEENQWIDFKQKDYHQDPDDPEKYKREICKDVTAMANTAGGYIFIGVQEGKDGKAQGFFTVDNPDKVVRSITGICLDHIDPRIPYLEVKKRSFEWNDKDITLVIIHIPPSEMAPHSIVWQNSTDFVKRYGDQTRGYPVSELSVAFSTRYYPLTPDQIDNTLNLVSRTQQIRRSQISPTENALEQEDFRDLLHLMRLRFENATSDVPYFRILAVPTTLNPNVVATQEQEIQEILQNPPAVRNSMFGVKNVTDILPSSEGIRGTNTWSNQELILLRNGFFELRSPLSSEHFQWAKEEFEIPDDSNWLYPYAICEYLVTFMMLVKKIYFVAGIDSEILVQQEYRKLSGFLLVGGDPVDSFFGTNEESQHVYTEPHAIGLRRSIEPEFVPDRVAYDLVKELYASFGLSEELIPLFDVNHNFVP